MLNNIETKWDLMLNENIDAISKIKSDQFFFNEFMKIIENNSDIDATNHFIIWIRENCLISQTMAVRRVVDKKSGTNSLIRLLFLIKGNPQVLSRERYTTLFTGTGFEGDEVYINQDFDKLVGKGKNHLMPENVQNDIDVISSKYAKLKSYVDKRIAHVDRNPDEVIPTIYNLNECIKVLEQIANKYYTIIHASSYGSLTPTLQYDWEKVLRIPWIKND